MADEIPEQSDIPRPKVETIIREKGTGASLAILDGVALWPPKESVFELTYPNRDAIVRSVRLRLAPNYASVIVVVEDQGSVIPAEGD